MQAIRSYSNAYSTAAAMVCAGAFLLMLATSISNYLIWISTVGVADWSGFLGEFVLPAIPLALALVLLAIRSKVAATMVATLGTLFYLFVWATLGI